MRKEFEVTELEDYLECPRRYKFFHGEGLRKPRHITVIEAECHSTALKRAMVENLDFDSHLSLFKGLFDAKRAFVGRTRLEMLKYRRTESHILHQARCVLGVWHHTVKTRLKVPLPWIEGEERTFSSDSYKVYFTPDIMVGAAPLWFICGYNLSKLVRHDRGLRIITTMAASKDKKIPVHQLEVNLRGTKKCVVLRCMIHGGTWRKAKNIIRDVGNAINAGVFPRCDPRSLMCHINGCEFYEMCMNYLER